MDSTERDLTVTLALVKRAQAGSREALECLLARYQARVLAIVRLRLGSELRRRLESGDILQETLVAAIRGFDRFEMRDEGSLVNWLSKLAERQVLAAAQHHGARKRELAREVPLSDSGAQAIHAAGARQERRPEEQAIEAEEAGIVESCLRALPEDYREAIILREYAGASWQAVAAALGKPSEDAARMLHARAMIALGKLARRGKAD